MTDPLWTASAIAAAVRSGERSAAELVAEALARARSNAELGAFWHLDPEGALAAAAAVDDAVARRADPGPLAGVPVAVKDAFEVADWPGGGGGEPVMGVRDAEAVARLRRAGAVVVGKLAMHQLGWGMAGQAPGRPPCRNPLQPELQPGGSSSGSAVAVAAGIVSLALGGDSGGSVRQPAAWCGVVGVKPAQDRGLNGGLVPLAVPLDTVGTLATTVEDALLGLEALGLRYPPPADVRGLTIGVAKEAIERSEPAVAKACQAALDGLAAAGARLVDVEMPGRGIPLATIFAFELAAAIGPDVDAHPQRYGEDVRAGVAAGRAISVRDYRSAMTAREAARVAPWTAAHLVVTPTCPILPPRLDEPDDVRRAGRLTRPFNALDWPALSVPVGTADAPVGLQLAAPRGHEAPLFGAARAVEAHRAAVGVRSAPARSWW